ncbi:MAG TPA: phage holin family protein [Verrucomicrobiae bacterium]|nr:phage holin family protein [Verrucomicrobiae bacterium]
MHDTNGADQGVFESSKRFLRTTATIAQNRLELLLVEVQEERTRLFDMLMLAAGAVAFGLMALITISFTLVVVFWDEHRLAVLVGLSVIYVLAAAAGFWQLNARLKKWQAFSATLAELRKDCAWLDAQRENSSDSASRH